MLCKYLKLLFNYMSSFRCALQVNPALHSLNSNTIHPTQPIRPYAKNQPDLGISLRFTKSPIPFSKNGALRLMLGILNIFWFKDVKRFMFLLIFQSHSLLIPLASPFFSFQFPENWGRLQFFVWFHLPNFYYLKNQVAF